MTRKPDATVFHSLDLLRGIAAVAVAGRHFNGQIYDILPSSHLAVDLFFVLSGFVIAHAYSSRMASGLGVISFMKIRLVRLYPLYALGTALGLAGFLFVVLTKGKWLDWHTVGASIALGGLFLPAPRQFSATGFHLFPFNFPVWSLFWELVINFIYALIARWLNNAVLAGIVVAGAVMLWFGADAPKGLDGGTNFRDYDQGALRVVYSFFVGIAVYRIWQSRKFARFTLPPLVCAAILLAVMAVRPASPALYDFGVALIVFPLLVLAATRNPAGRWVSLCTALGVISYPIYVLHAPMLKVYARLLEKIGSKPDALMIAFEVVFLIGLMVMAWLADRYFDRPVRSLLNRRA